MAFQSNGFQQNAFQGAGAQQGGGPVQLGPIAIVCAASLSVSQKVRRSVKPSPAGIALAVALVGVRRATKASPAGVASITSPIGVRRSIKASPLGGSLIAVSFQTTTTVSLGPIVVVGVTNWDLPYSVHRGITLTFHTPAGSGGMSTKMGSVAGQLLPAAIAFWRASVAAMKPPKSSVKYSGSRGQVQSEHPVFPPGTMDAGDPDLYVEAAAAYDEIMHEPVEPELDVNLLLGRKLLAIQRGRPLIERPPTGEKLVRSIEQKYAREVNRENRARMAWVRTFKKKT